MRTAIFLGLTAIADAIRHDWLSKDERIIAFASIALIAMMLMDIGDFIKNMSKKN